MSDQPVLKLFQLCGQIDEEQREGLRILLDGSEFTYASDAYVLRQNDTIQDAELKLRDEDRCWVLYCSTKPPKEEVEKDEPYTPTEPKYRHIGI